MSEDQERHNVEIGRSEDPDVEGHAWAWGTKEDKTEGERHENDEPDVEGHAFETGPSAVEPGPSALEP